jgi:Phosphotransferase enzyme family
LRFLAVYARGAPRWLVPEVDSAFISAAGWSPYRPWSRLSWAAVRGAARLRLLRFMPQVESAELHNRHSIDWRALGWKLLESPALCVYIGTPGSTQKAVLHLIDRQSGCCEAIVKVPLAPPASLAILCEAETLRVLAEEKFAAAPVAVAVDRELGTSAQQFIPGHPGSRSLRPEHLQLLGSLVLSDEITTLAEHGAAWQRIAAEKDGADAALLRSAVAALEDDHALPACWVHGDFAPWNIRQRSTMPPVLIDWEEAQRGGLPLHDAFHFLHIQDYLFRGKPCLHADDLAGFGRSLTLNLKQCRRLEIAYLAQSYFHCQSRRDYHRAQFVSRTLARAIKGYALAAPKQSMFARAASLEREPAGSRAELFDALIANLHKENIAYCVLGGHESRAGSGTPDLDLMVRTEDRRRIPQVLLHTALNTGARLVQAIQHETTATYFILARADATQIAHLDVDCYTDYRRDSRTWLHARDLIARRREFRDFFLPSVADEFTYYLIKKVLKQAIAPHQLKRLQHLLARDPGACRERLAQLWPANAPLLQQTITAQDFRALRRLLPELYLDLDKSYPREALPAHIVDGWHELQRCFSRVTAPTGMWLQIAGSTSEMRSSLAAVLAERLAPAFRRARLISGSNTGNLKVWMARIESTLLVSAAQSDLAIRPRASLQALPNRPDLAIVLACGQSEVPLFADASSVVHLAASTNFEELVHQSCEAVLHWLAARVRRRLRLSDSLAPEVSCDTAEQQLSPAGSD